MSNITPHDNDILFGRGYTISAHPGNRYLRSVVQDKKQAFLLARKKEKRDIAIQVVSDIQGLSPPGRFLMEDSKSQNGGNNNDNEGIMDKAWIIVETEKAVCKVMHRLREKDKGYVPKSKQAKKLNPQQPLLQQATPSSGANPSSEHLASFLPIHQETNITQTQQQHSGIPSISPESPVMTKRTPSSDNLTVTSQSSNPLFQETHQTLNNNLLAMAMSDNLTATAENPNPLLQETQQSLKDNLLIMALREAKQQQDLAQLREAGNIINLARSIRQINNEQQMANQVRLAIQQLNSQPLSLPQLPLGAQPLIGNSLLEPEAALLPSYLDSIASTRLQQANSSQQPSVLQTSNIVNLLLGAQHQPATSQSLSEAITSNQIAQILSGQKTIP
mmetsp:Transcript_5207/g.9555  ORF Transcript_5207/g.9555 Transcript_5207/m.9555 type:complete len:389 (+) Transcript_5207:207-1373(+)